jgi:hypothetical protein
MEEPIEQIKNEPEMFSMATKEFEERMAGLINSITTRVGIIMLTKLGEKGFITDALHSINEEYNSAITQVNQELASLENLSPIEQQEEQQDGIDEAS